MFKCVCVIIAFCMTFQDICRNIICSKIHTIDQGSCMDRYSGVEDIEYELNVRLIPLSTITLLAAFLNTVDIVQEVSRWFSRYDMCAETVIYGFQGNNDDIKENLLFMESIYLVESSYLFGSPSDFISTMIKSFHGKHLSVYVAGKKYDFLVYVTHTPTALLQMYNFMFNLEMCKNPLLYLKSALEKKVVLSDGTAFISLKMMCAKKYCPFSISRVLGLEYNVIGLTSCPKVKLNLPGNSWHKHLNGSLVLSDNFNIDSTLFYTISQETLTFTSIEYSNTIYMCLDVFKGYVEHMSTKNAKILSTDAYFVVSSIFTILSILALSVTSIMFIIFSRLRLSIHHKNLMTLSVVMLGSEITFLASQFTSLQTTSIACVTVSCLVHFFSLLSLFWLNVSVIHAFFVLKHQRKSPLHHVSSNTNVAKHMFIYHMYASTITMLFLSLHVVISVLSFGTSGYGMISCTFSYPWLILYTFGIPVGIVVGANLSMFTMVIKTPQIQVKHNDVTKEQTKATDINSVRCDIVEMTKLTLLIGVTWLFGIVWLYTSFDVLEYLFSILKGSQGVFLAYVVFFKKH